MRKLMSTIRIIGNIFRNRTQSAWSRSYVYLPVALFLGSARFVSTSGSCQMSGLKEGETVHAAHITEVHNVPMSVILRPIPSVLDEKKVLSLMETLQVLN